jgi:hypothetical protein
MSILGYGGIPDGDDTECSSESANGGGNGDGETRAVFWSRQEGVYFSYKYRQVLFLPPFMDGLKKKQKNADAF